MPKRKPTPGGFSRVVLVGLWRSHQLCCTQFSWSALYMKHGGQHSLLMVLASAMRRGQVGCMGHAHAFKRAAAMRQPYQKFLSYASLCRCPRCQGHPVEASCSCL